MKITIEIDLSEALGPVTPDLVLPHMQQGAPIQIHVEPAAIGTSVDVYATIVSARAADGDVHVRARQRFTK